MVTARAVLHVGLPKTGTSFLQGTMRANTGPLSSCGVRLPDAEGERLFQAVLHLTGRSESWGRSDERGRKSWSSTVREIKGHHGTTVVSSETLCLADEAQIERILDDLAGVQVEVVVTLRDPARQLPAEWQEGVKHGRRVKIQQFLDVVLSEPDKVKPGRRKMRDRFWAAQDPVTVIDRWAGKVGSDRVRVVTCPPPGAPPDELWRRFATVIGADDAEVAIPDKQLNTSLGQVQTEVLRRINRRIGRKGNEKTYGDIVKRLYAGRILRAQGGDKVLLPRRYRQRVAAVAEHWISHLEDRGYAVVGDLDDLRPRYDDSRGGLKVTNAQLLEASLDATAELLKEVERLRAEKRGLSVPVPRPGSRRDPAEEPL